MLLFFYFYILFSIALKISSACFVLRTIETIAYVKTANIIAIIKLIFDEILVLNIKKIIFEQTPIAITEIKTLIALFIIAVDFILPIFLSSFIYNINAPKTDEILDPKASPLRPINLDKIIDVITFKITISMEFISGIFVSFKA